MLLHEISLCHAGWITVSMHITQRHHGGDVTQLEYTLRVSNMPSVVISLPQSQTLALEEGASTETMLKSHFCLSFVKVGVSDVMIHTFRIRTLKKQTQSRQRPCRQKGKL